MVKNKYEKNNVVAMTWRMRWLNRSIITINTTFQLLYIYNIKIKVDKYVKLKLPKINL